MVTGDSKLHKLELSHKARQRRQLDTRVTAHRRDLVTTMTPPNIDPTQRSIAWNKVLNSIARSPRAGPIPPIDNKIDLENTLGKLYGIYMPSIIIDLKIVANNMVSCFSSDYRN
jgi:hypothetical protein